MDDGVGQEVKSFRVEGEGCGKLCSKVSLRL